MPLYSILQVLSGDKAETMSNVLPKELSVVVNDLSTDIPTHMLAVYSHQVPAAIKHWVTLFPMHNIILASHCSNLPILQSLAPATPKLADESILIPIVSVHCTRGFPPTFHLPLPQAHRPSPCNPAAFTEDPTSENMRTQLQQFTTKLAALTPAYILLVHTMAVNFGLWRNACALGIADEKLWCAMDAAWEVLYLDWQTALPLRC